MTQTEHEDYSQYLLKRSPIGKYYRNHWLYPRICRYLLGDALDIGCGIGDMLAFRKGTVGVDINPYNVDYCCQRGLDARLMKVDLLPFEGEVFDSLLLDNVLEHISDPVPLMRELRRVLRPKGKLLIGVPGYMGQTSDPDHKVFYDEAALEWLANSNGFKVIRFLYMPFWRSNWLSSHIRQYCIYSQWQIADRPISDC